MRRAFHVRAGARQVGVLHCVEAGHSFVEPMGDDAGSSAQRIRIGLTGLAFAFLLVLLGSVVSRSGDDSAPPTEAERIAANDAQPSEPLAELGVAPGTTEEEKVEEAEAEVEAEAQGKNFVGPRP